MQLRPDSIFQEFLFTEQENISARTLTSLQIAWLQTKYTRVFKEKASKIVPEDATLDRSYFLSLGELEGKLAILQEIFDDHKAAVSIKKELNATEGVGADALAINDLATRASKLVDKHSS